MVMISFIVIIIFIILAGALLYFVFLKGSVNNRMDKAKQAMESGNLDAALAMYLKLRKDKVDSTELILALGEIYYETNQYPLAEEELKRVLAREDYKHHMTEYELRKMLSDIYLKTSRYDKAYEECLLINRINPEDIKVVLNLALICIKTKKYKLALNYLEKI